jgi:Xaa-Pro dipeptidase
MREVADAWRIGDDARNPPRLMRSLDELRRIKSAYERVCLIEASARASRGHAELQRAFRGGGESELSLHLRYLSTTQQDDSQTPYKNIVAIDEHAAVLHHVLYDAEPPQQAGHSLLVDAGATCFGYASDITRTIAHGPGCDEFASLIGGVESIQRSMCDQLRPGLAYEALHDQAHGQLGALLHELGIGRASADELVERGVTRVFMPHGLGHSLGIQVHDVGCRVDLPRPENRYLRTTVDVEEGMVFTIEPGCYFIEPLLGPLRTGAEGELVDWAVVDRLKRFGGVRIEDNLLVTASGAENLTRGAWPTA